ncbi:MAG: 6,7-dimethyl-8-ribityllumazine synthase [Candidatus Thermoplasmatota archaeon]|nr:6,7-dimethyl-8-ribityllumazine synthase [Candidatus Thermoplasmatota archaeon]
MFKIAIICTSFHEKEIKKMLKKVEEVSKNIDTIELSEVYWVPGALEIPYALRKIEKEHDKVNSHNDGYVVLGIIEKGETDHGLVMGQVVIRQLMKFQIKKGKPVGIGIIGPGADPKQIKDRIEMHAENAILAVEHLLKEPKEWK